MDRNTRHSVDKSKEFINSGMTLITDPESDRYLGKYKNTKDKYQRQQSSWTTKEVSTGLGPSEKSEGLPVFSW